VTVITGVATALLNLDTAVCFLTPVLVVLASAAVALGALALTGHG
jgi:hypothetical protein